MPSILFKILKLAYFFILTSGFSINKIFKNYKIISLKFTEKIINLDKAQIIAL